MANYNTAGTKSAQVTVGDGSWNTTTGCSATIPSSMPTQTNPVAINYFTVSPSTIIPGQSTTFSWGSNLTSTDVSYYGGGCYISPSTNASMELNINANYGPSGTFTYVPPAYSTTYTLTCLSGGKDGSPTATQQVTVSSVAAISSNSAQITSPNSAIPNAAFTVSGSSSLSGSLRVVVLSANYTGPTDWNDVQQLIVNGQTTYTQESSAVSVTNGHWVATFNGLPEATYDVYVYDLSGDLISQEVFYSTYKG
jgi:hypothetical protein